MLGFIPAQIDGGFVQARRDMYTLAMQPLAVRGTFPIFLPSGLTTGRPNCELQT
jgi:hypothetical protein